MIILSTRKVMAGLLHIHLNPRMKIQPCMYCRSGSYKEQEQCLLIRGSDLRGQYVSSEEISFQCCFDLLNEVSVRCHFVADINTVYYSSEVCRREINDPADPLRVSEYETLFRSRITTVGRQPIAKVQ
jgi:hypothetical protein